MISLVASTEHHCALYLFGLSCSFAFLTKSFHVVPIVLIGSCYLVAIKFWHFFKFREIISATIIALIPILTWGVFRYLADGMSFLGIMFATDVKSRMAHGASAGGSYLGFIKYMISYRPIQVLLIVGFVCCIFKAIVGKDSFKKLHNSYLMLIIWLIITVLFFSLTRTVESWYYYPTFLCIMLLDSFLLSDVIFLFTDTKNYNQLILKRVVCITLVFSFAFGVLNIYRNINETFSVRESTSQTAITDFSQRNPSYHGYNCYMIKSKSEDLYPYQIKEGIWEQCDVLCAEINGDYKCINGGVSVFLQDVKSLIFIEDALLSQYISHLDGYSRYYVNGFHIFANEGIHKK